MALRHKEALLVQNAVNPCGIAASLHDAFREVLREGGDTPAQKNDPACKLILHQLCHLLGLTGIESLTEYRLLIEECERKSA